MIKTVLYTLLFSIAFSSVSMASLSDNALVKENRSSSLISSCSVLGSLACITVLSYADVSTSGMLLLSALLATPVVQNALAREAVQHEKSTSEETIQGQNLLQENDTIGQDASSLAMATGLSITNAFPGSEARSLADASLSLAAVAQQESDRALGSQQSASAFRRREVDSSDEESSSGKLGAGRATLETWLGASPFTKIALGSAVVLIGGYALKHYVVAKKPSKQKEKTEENSSEEESSSVQTEPKTTA